MTDEGRTVPVAIRPTELRGVQLTVVAGPNAGLSSRAERPVLRVGTAPDNDLVLKDTAVSRHHFELHLKRDSVRIKDRGSTNGTRVDGVRVTDAFVQPGQRIEVGESELRVLASDAPVRVTLSSRSSFGNLLGESAAMRALFAVLERVAASEVSVLISGESGTGKELAAEAIHQHSRRSRGPFVVIDCSAIPQHLFESELFGHTRGSFTGATEERKGLLEEADGGTAFFDEVGELPLEQQAKLLRALERREIRRVGSNKTRPIDVRVLAATNRDLVEEVDRGAFREDLYYRLAVARADMPPLRARREDIPLLVRRFVESIEPASVDRAAPIAASLVGRSFGGNVRELRNAVQVALTFRPEDDEAASAPVDVAAGGLIDVSRYYDLSYADAVEAITLDFQRAYLTEAVRREHGNLSAVARHKAMSRRHLQRVLSRIGLRASGLDEEELDP